MSEELISKAAAQNAEMATWNLEAIRSRESGIQEIRENPELTWIEGNAFDLLREYAAAKASLVRKERAMGLMRC